MSARRLLVRPLVVLVRGYQRVISPMRPATCRFHPTCSAYAVDALEQHGLLRGTWLAVRRLSRCHPWNAGGVDYVPGDPRWATYHERLATAFGEHETDPTTPGEHPKPDTNSVLAQAN